MKDFRGFEEVVARMAEARRQARDNGPRGSNDELEAAMLLAQMFAYNDWATEQNQQQAAVNPADTPPAAEQQGTAQPGPAQAEQAEQKTEPTETE